MTISIETKADAEPKERRSKVAPMVVLVLTAGLLALIGVRYKQAVAERAAFTEAGAIAATTPETSATRPVRIARGAATQWQPNVSVSGTLAPIRETDLSFKVPGRLATVSVKVGDVVKAGQQLATLDASDVVAQLRAAQAQVHSAEVSLEIARDEEGRSKALLTQGAVSDAQHRANAQRTELSRAALEAAQAQAATVAAMLDNTRLTAPFAGLVTRAPTGPGAVVNPNMPGTSLMRIEDTSALRFTGTLTLEDAALVHVGTPIDIDGSVGGESSVHGVITAILPSVDAQTRRVPVLAEIKNDPKAPLLAGVFARATLRGSHAVDVVKVPGEALRPGSQDELVIFEAGHARVVHAVFSHASDGTLLVRDGVRATDDVVLSPSASVKTGDALTTGPAGGEPSEPGAPVSPGQTTKAAPSAG